MCNGELNYKNFVKNIGGKYNFKIRKESLIMI